MDEPLNHPFYEVFERAQEVTKEGATVFFKFTCVNCGSRQTFDAPNILYEEGICEECGATTNLKVTGCNYVLII
jgi:ribosomal protein L40E